MRTHFTNIFSEFLTTSGTEEQTLAEMRTLWIYIAGNQVPRVQRKALLSLLWWYVSQASQASESRKNGK